MSISIAARPAFNRLTDRRQINRLVYLCTIVYFTSYVTRINYGAVVAEIIASEGIAKNAASLAVTGLFVTYGVGQLISGWLGDRISPKYLMAGGMLLATFMNLLLPLNTNPGWMLAVWCINGFGQALMWPPIVKLLTNYLSDEEYVRATVKVSWGSSLGTIAVYLAAPVCITLAGWRTVFYLAAVCGLIGAVLCLAGVTSVEKHAASSGTPYTPCESDSLTSRGAPSGSFGSTGLWIVAPIFAAIALQGTLRDGVTTWMPSYIAETFNLGTSISILTGVILPVFGLFCIHASRALYVRLVKNELRLSGMMFGAAALAAGVLAVLSGASPVLSVVCSTVIVGCMHAINLMLVCVVPGKFKETGNISTVSGVLNFATYVGAALSTYGFAALSELVGWQGTIVLWFAVAFCGMAVCLFTARFWRR